MKVRNISIAILVLLANTAILANGVDTTTTQIYAPSAYRVVSTSSGVKVVTFRPGSLRANIERIGRLCGWPRVVWKVPNDYNWESYTIVKKPAMQGVLKATLKNYPVQAVFYEGNHILVIKPRTLR